MWRCTTTRKTAAWLVIIATKLEHPHSIWAFVSKATFAGRANSFIRCIYMWPTRIISASLSMWIPGIKLCKYPSPMIGILLILYTCTYPSHSLIKLSYDLSIHICTVLQKSDFSCNNDDIHNYFRFHIMTKSANVVLKIFHYTVVCRSNTVQYNMILLKHPL